MALSHLLSACRIVDGMECSSQAKYEVKFDGRHIGYVCGVHARAYIRKTLFPLMKEASNAKTDRDK